MNKSDYWSQKIRKDEFQKIVGSVPNHTPFLLFPLRIETHFRKGKAATVAEKNDTLEILKTVASIVGKLNAGKFDFVPELAQLKAKLAVAESVENFDKHHLLKVLLALQNAIPINLPDNQYEKIALYMKEIVALARAIKGNDNKSYNKTTYFIKRLRRCFNALHTLSDVEKLPYRSPKYFKIKEHETAHNPKLYHYIDHTLDQSIAFLNISVKMLDSISSLTPRQCPAIKRALFPGSRSEFNIDNDLKNIPDALENVYPKDSCQANSLTEEYYSNWSTKLNIIEEKVGELKAKYDSAAFKEKIKSMNSYQEKFTNAAGLLLTALMDFPLSNHKTPTWNKRIGNINAAMEHIIYTSSGESNFIAGLWQDFNKMLTPYRTRYDELIFKQKQLAPYNSHEPETPAKELCVRIFPDEIFLDYLTEGLTEQEIADGKFFWMQWYIASGSEAREYEAWQVMCRKYKTHRAAWIVRCLKPKDLDDFRKTGDLFYRRPYPQLDKIETEIERLYKNLNNITLNEEDVKRYQTGEWSNEYEIRTFLRRAQWNLYQISRNTIACEYIVDYLYDNILTALNYLKRRLSYFISFYRKFPGKYGGNTRHMELWDVDQTMLLSFAKEVDELIVKLADKYISLEEMVGRYLQNPKHNYFINSDVKVNQSGKHDIPSSLILPERFVFIGEDSATKARIVRYGRKVRQNLQLGVDPNEDDEAIPYKINEKGELEVNGGISWMVDYDKAEEAGMAITVPLDSSTTGFSYIYVLGVKDSQEKDKEYLEELFNSHNYSTSGLEMLKIGTPTNFVDGIDIEGRNVFDVDEEALMRYRYDIEVNEAYKKNDYQGSDSRRLSDLLGLDYGACWANVKHADNTDWERIEKVNAVIWEYFMPGLFSNGAFGRGNDAEKPAQKNFTDNTNVEEFLRGLPYFLKYYCKGSGIIPPFKIGDQPYGILPITDFMKFHAIYGVEKAFGAVPSKTDELESKFISQLNKILILLSERWKALRKELVNSAVNLYADKPDDDQGDNAQTRYLKMAGLTPHSVTFYEREMVESPFVSQNLRYSYLTYSTDFHKKLAAIFDWESVDAEPYTDFLDMTKLFDIHPVKELVKQISLSEADAYPVPAWISKLKTQIKKEVKDLNDRDCNRLIAQFFDLFTYRIDAWFMAILHYNLYKFGQLNGKRQRKDFALNAPKIGAFGWVFNLREKSRQEIADKDKVVKQMNLKDTTSPIYKNTGSDSDEYIVAPSVQHAIAAAVLRSGYRKSQAGVNDARMAVNLTSMRARQALRLIDGIKSGMSTGIVLGADLENYMHNAYKFQFDGQYCEMDQYVYPLRKMFPQTVDIEAEDERADNYIMQVVNGEAILNCFRNQWNYQGSVFDFLNKYYKRIPELAWVDTLFGNQSAHRKCMFKLIERMADSYDALSDLLLSEGVYRLIQGNRAAFASIINFMAKGSGNLPEPAILNTPMEHVVSEYKVAVAFPDYKQLIQRPMCIAEPSMNLWLEQLMGNLKNIYYIIKRNDGEKDIYEKMTLSETSLHPIEYLYLSSDETPFFSYLEMQYRLKTNNFTEEVAVFSSAPEVFGENDFCDYEVNDDEWSLFENEIRINSLRGLLHQSRRMKANDWLPETNSDTEDDNALNMEELIFRHNALMNWVKNLNLQMLSRKNNLTEEYYADAVLIEMCRLLSQCAEMGMTGCFATFKAGMFIDRIDKVANRPLFDRAVTMQQDFVASFEFVQSQLEKRIAEAEAILQQKDPARFSSELYIEAMQKVLLSSFKIFPKFTIQPATTREQRDNYDNILSGGVSYYKNLSELGFETWANDVAEVREGMKKWNHIRMFQNMCGQDVGKPAVIQMNSNGDTSLKEWLGCEVSNESVLDDVDSLVIYNSEAVKIRHDVSYHSGMIFDSWLEYIPYQKQSAGMVFHCDQPDAEAPQSLLLAISPDFHCAGDKRWSVNSLVGLVEEARFLAMNRAVEPDHIYQDLPDYKSGSYLSTIFPLLSKKID